MQGFPQFTSIWNAKKKKETAPSYGSTTLFSNVGSTVRPTLVVQYNFHDEMKHGFIHSLMILTHHSFIVDSFIHSLCLSVRAVRGVSEGVLYIDYRLHSTCYKP